METTKDEYTIWKIIGGIVSALIITGIVAIFSRMENYNERLIRIEERAKTNADGVTDIKSDVSDVKSEQKRASDRMTQVEFKIGILSEKK